MSIIEQRNKPTLTASGCYDSNSSLVKCLTLEVPNVTWWWAFSHFAFCIDLFQLQYVLGQISNLCTLQFCRDYPIKLTIFSKSFFVLVPTQFAF